MNLTNESILNLQDVKQLVEKNPEIVNNLFASLNFNNTVKKFDPLLNKLQYFKSSNQNITIDTIYSEPFDITKLELSNAKENWFSVTYRDLDNVEKEFKARILEFDKNGIAYPKLIKCNKIEIISVRYYYNDIFFRFNLMMLYEPTTNYEQIKKKIIERLINLIHVSKNNMSLINRANAFNEENLGVPINFVLYDFNRNTYKQVKSLEEQNIKEEMKLLRLNNCYDTRSGNTQNTIHKHKDNNKIYTPYNLTSLIPLITCTRLPEIIGLLTHEYLHWVDLDLSTPKKGPTGFGNSITSIPISNKIEDDKVDILVTELQNTMSSIKNDYLMNTDLNILETFANTTATIMHVLFTTTELFDNNLEENFKLIYKIEILYSIYHCAKVLHFLGFNSFDDFFNIEKENRKKYYQNGKNFEYSVLRSIILMFNDDYVDFFTFTDGNEFSFDENFNKETILRKVLPFFKKIHNFMIGKNLNEAELIKRALYEKIFNGFIDIIKNYSDNVNPESCGNINMEYFCIDPIDVNNQNMSGGRKNYYNKYLKYKKKYLLAKNK